MSRDIMSEQQNNIEFVKEVQKHPTLYNYKLPTYSRKDISDQAWEEVGKATNMTPSACRERWRNLRAVYMRTRKASLRGSGKKKPYYLADVMEFIVPYLRPMSTEEKQKRIQRLSEVYNSNKIEEEDPILVRASQIKVENLEDVDTEEWCPQSSQELSLTRKRPHEPEDHQSNKKVVQTPVAQSSLSSTPDNDHVKSFLNSLLPELNEMNSAQFKNFKRRVLLLIDEITTEIPSNSLKRINESEYIM